MEKEVKYKVILSVGSDMEGLEISDLTEEVTEKICEDFFERGFTKIISPSRNNRTFIDLSKFSVLQIVEVK